VGKTVQPGILRWYVIIIIAINGVKGDIVTVLEDLVEIDSIILDLEGRDYVLSVNAYETRELFR
jgi:hypothetical protein